MAKQNYLCRSFAMGLPAALMFYGVLSWLICRAVRENKKKRQDI